MIDNHQYYPTPEALSIKAWETFKNKNFVRVLEPSVGEGHLLKPRPFNHWQKIPVDCIEIDISKHPVLRSQGYSVVGMDFMQFKSGSLYSHVLMNPPFADGAQHVLKAWEILFDGEIVAILNAETLKNPFSKERKHLLRLIEQFGEVEYLPEMFASQDAERKTDVEIALVWLKKTSTFEEEILGNILDDLRRDQASAESLADDCQPSHELALANAFIDNAVLMFNAAVEAARQSAFSESRAMRYRKMLGQTLGELNGDAAIKSTQSTLDWVKNQLYTDYTDLKDRAWSGILRSTQVTSRLSSAAQKRLESDFETIKSLEFTVPNIYGFLQGIIDQQGDIQLGMVCDVFDLITRYHSDNAVLYMGWNPFAVVPLALHIVSGEIAMSTATIKRLLILLGMLAGSLASAEVTVRFEQPDHYTDLSLSGSSTQNIQDDLMRQFEKHLKQLGEHYLPKGDVLDIIVQDIDMAGAVEPWRTPQYDQHSHHSGCLPAKNFVALHLAR